MGILFKVFLLFSAALVVYKASEFFILSLKKLSKDGLLGKFFLASIFAGVATSLPEIFVSLSSSFEGYPHLSIGNAIGSNIADISFVIPLAIFLSGREVKIDDESFSLRSALLVLAATVLPFMLVLDRVLSFYDGIFLIFMFFVYSIYVFKGKKERGIFSFLRRFKEALADSSFWKGLVGVVLSLAILVVGSDVIVKLSVDISHNLGLSVFVTGVVFVALATSLPELFVATVALAKGEAAVFFGDILGSLVTNANLVIGLSVLRRAVVFLDLTSYAVSVIALFIAMGLFYAFSFTKKKIERWEGAVLFAAYLIFLFLEHVF